MRTAQHAWEKSCYFNIDYKVDENESVYDAVRRMAAYNVGCLIVTTNGRVSADAAAPLAHDRGLMKMRRTKWTHKNGPIKADPDDKFTN